MAVGACQNFQFFTQISRFHEIIELCLKLGIRFCITLLLLLSNNEKITT